MDSNLNRYGEERKINQRESPDHDNHDENSNSQHEEFETYTSIRYSDVRELVVRFTFRYRPIGTWQSSVFELLILTRILFIYVDILRSCGIAPRSASVQPPSSLLASGAQAQDTETSHVAETEKLPPVPRPVQGQEATEAQQNQSQLFRQTDAPILSNSQQLPPSHDQEVRCEDASDDDIYVPLQPPSNTTTTITNEEANMPSGLPRESSSKSVVLPAEDEKKPDLSEDSDEDENDEEIKALQVVDQPEHRRT